MREDEERQGKRRVKWRKDASFQFGENKFQYICIDRKLLWPKIEKLNAFSYTSFRVFPLNIKRK